MTDAQKLAHKKKYAPYDGPRQPRLQTQLKLRRQGLPQWQRQQHPLLRTRKVQQALQVHYPNSGPPVFTYMGKTYRATMANRAYKASGIASLIGSLVDGGCNGGLTGADVLIMDEHSYGKVDIVGVADNLIKNIPLCTAAGLIQTNKGPNIGIMHNYAALKTGGSIHSPLQFKDHGIFGQLYTQITATIRWRVRTSSCTNPFWGRQQVL
jgi:hypothetical protein